MKEAFIKLNEFLVRIVSSRISNPSCDWLCDTDEVFDSSWVLVVVVESISEERAFTWSFC
jgi:hypothetical protein